MKKNAGLIITTIIIIAVVAATAFVAVFAGVVALIDYTQETESETQQVQGSENEGSAENLGNNGGGSQSGDQNGSGSETESEGIRDEAEYTDDAITGAEMPEEIE